MSINALALNGSDDFEVLGMEQRGDKIEIMVVSRQPGSKCPGCEYQSSKVHSYYQRTFLDLPMLGHETMIRIRVRKFYCTNDGCQKKIFSERFERHFQYRKRMTERVCDKVKNIALLMGGNGGRKICTLMNMPVSSSTLTRSVHGITVPVTESLSAVGIDDWAYKKGRTYGTVVVDLNKRKIVDLLPDREAGTVKEWLSNHPEIEVVSRDRYSNYAVAANAALPGAAQVADRWHLIKNLGDSVQRVLERCQGLLKQQAKCHYQETESVLPPTPCKKKSSKTEESLAKRQLLMDKVKLLYREGHSIREISRRMILNRATVRRYLIQEVALPKCFKTTRKKFAFEEYIVNAIATRPGITAVALYEEIVAMGYDKKKTVGYTTISSYMSKKNKITYPEKQPLLYWRPAEVSLFLYRRLHELRSRDRDLLQYLCRESLEVNQAYTLFQRFRDMIETKQGFQLKKWIDDVISTSIKELQSFARGVIQDFSAVQNALTLPWSNGQVEGQINKLKTLKRQMYGRASFNLLRKRLICETG